MKFGDFEIRAFVEQKFKLDGGSMFGIIPKSMWSKQVPSDENNLIPMVTNLFVLKAHDRVFLFEAGLGDSLSEKEKKVYGTDGKSRLESGLDSMGLTVEDINYVILTHLHTDHCGGAVKKKGRKYMPRFPHATYIIGQREWDDAMHPDERTRAVYSAERLLPLEESGQATFIDCDTELFPGINLVFTGGHTRGHFGIEIQSGRRKVFYYSDIFCTSAHMKVPVVAAADLYPLDTMDVKRRKLPEIVNRDVVMAFDHDIYAPLAKIKSVKGKIVVHPVQTGLDEFQDLQAGRVEQ